MADGRNIIKIYIGLVRKKHNSYRYRDIFHKDSGRQS